MRKPYLLVFTLLILLLSGCLQQDTPCHFFSLVRKKIDNQTWKVDTFAVFISDSASGYRVDTVYANDGTFKFISLNNPYSCIDSGNIVFTRANFPPVFLQYSMQPDNYFFEMLSPSSIDGYANGDTIIMNYYLTANKLYLTQYDFGDSTYSSWRYDSISNQNIPYMVNYRFVRNWGFVLSKN